MPKNDKCIIKYMAKSFFSEVFDGCLQAISAIIALALFGGIPIGIVFYFFGQKGVDFLIVVVGTLLVISGICLQLIRLYQEAKKDCE